ncbi:MAG: hypothetical protein IPM92_09420 [Saprospiraceae bacterium]|nr:hypothetical protein [Saprospiraceae bacterium]
MSTNELIINITKLPVEDRLKIIEMVIKTLQEFDGDKLEKASFLMLDDYMHDQNLTDLTSIDMENFYETRGNLAS